MSFIHVYDKEDQALAEQVWVTFGVPIIPTRYSCRECGSPLEGRLIPVYRGYGDEGLAIGVKKSIYKCPECHVYHWLGTSQNFVLHRKGWVRTKTRA